MAILVNQDTKVLVQGITGREALTFTNTMLEYGTEVVAGITPGKGGQTVHGIPVYNSVREAVERHSINATVVSVPPAFAKDATMEAIDANIELINVFTERIPRGDVIEFLEFAELRGVRVVGPNSLGVISPGKGKLGPIGGPVDETNRTFISGKVGIISRSGSMTTETANMLSVNGFGQSTAVSIGGDPIVGSTFREMLPLFEDDEQTEAIILFCEPGGNQEEQAAEYIKENNFSKPVLAFIGGRFVDQMEGVRFGHAAVIVEGEEGSTEKKVEALRDAGVFVADLHSDLVKELHRIFD